MKLLNAMATTMRFVKVATGILLSLGTAVASTTYDFTSTGFDGADPAKETRIATDNGDVAAISGSREFDDFASAFIQDPSRTGFATSPSGFFYYDNQLLPSGNPVIHYVPIFLIGDYAEAELNFFSTPPDTTAYLNDETGYGTFTIVDPSVVPEPGIFSMLAAGLLRLTWITSPPLLITSRSEVEHSGMPARLALHPASSMKWGSS